MISEGINGNQFAQIRSVLEAKFANDPLENKLKSKGRYRTPATSKIEFFESIVNCFQPLIIVTKSFFLDVQGC